MPDLHRLQTRYQNVVKSLWKSDLHKEDKQAVEQFLHDTRARGVRYARLIKLCQTLTMIGERLNKPFDKAREADIKKLVYHYEDGEYSFWTRHDVKVIIKQFYAWMNKGVYPKKVDWICTTIPIRDKRLVNHDNLLTVEEVNKLIDACDHPRNKALIAVLAESGARPGEIGNLTMSQICIDPNGVVLNLEGKTGCRRLRLVSSAPKKRALR